MVIGRTSIVMCKGYRKHAPTSPGLGYQWVPRQLRGVMWHGWMQHLLTVGKRWAHCTSIWSEHLILVLKTVRAPPKCYHKQPQEQTCHWETGSDGCIPLSACATLCTRRKSVRLPSPQVLMEALIAYAFHVWEDVRAEAKRTTSQLLVFPDLALNSLLGTNSADCCAAIGGVYFERCHTDITF